MPSKPKLNKIAEELLKTSENGPAEGQYTWGEGSKWAQWDPHPDKINYRDVLEWIRKSESTSRNAYPGMKPDKPWPYPTMLGHKVKFPNSNNKTGLAYFVNPTDDINARAREVLRKQFKLYNEREPGITLQQAVEKFDDSSPENKWGILQDKFPWTKKRMKNIKNMPLDYFQRGNTFNKPGDYNE